MGFVDGGNLEGLLVVCLDLYRDIDWIFFFFSVVVLAFG
jgi:hypothetical protein